MNVLLESIINLHNYAKGRNGFCGQCIIRETKIKPSLINLNLIHEQLQL